MEDIAGYARIIARTRIQQQANKPLIGKPYLKYGQCYWIWNYFFQLGGILGARHTVNLDAFGQAFLGARGPAGAVEKFFSSVATRLVTDYANSITTFADYVGTEFTGRIGYTGDANDFFIEHGMLKVSPSNAEELAWQYSEQGAALGAIKPHMIKEMFDRTSTPAPKEDWDEARAAGLDIPPEQDLMTYKETEEAENELFLAYCRECCPYIYSILSK